MLSHRKVCNLVNIGLNIYKMLLHPSKGTNSCYRTAGKRLQKSYTEELGMVSSTPNSANEGKSAQMVRVLCKQETWQHFLCCYTSRKTENILQCFKEENILCKNIHCNTREMMLFLYSSRIQCKSYAVCLHTLTTLVC